MARFFEKISRNFGLFFARPSSRCSSTRLASHTRARPAAMASTAPRKPSHINSAPPRKKPAPLRAFFEPVSRATHLYRVPWAASGTSSLMVLFADILLRSLATPDSAWAAITQGTVSTAAGTSSIPRATTCRPRPIFMVRLSPRCAPSQPPTRLVITPKIS